MFLVIPDGYKNRTYNSYGKTLIEQGIESPLCGYIFKLERKKKTIMFFLVRNTFVIESIENYIKINENLIHL